MYQERYLVDHLVDNELPKNDCGYINSCDGSYKLTTESENKAKIAKVTSSETSAGCSNSNQALSTKS